MLQNMIINYISKHSPPVVTIILCVFGCTVFISQVVEDGFISIKTELIAEARLPTYAMINASLHKQSEKFDNDTEDIKKSDVKFLYNQCSGDFGNIYVKTLPPSERLYARNTCRKLEVLYSSSN